MSEITLNGGNINFLSLEIIYLTNQITQVTGVKWDKYANIINILHSLAYKQCMKKAHLQKELLFQSILKFLCCSSLTINRLLLSFYLSTKRDINT